MFGPRQVADYWQDELVVGLSAAVAVGYPQEAARRYTWAMAHDRGRVRAHTIAALKSWLVRHDVQLAWENEVDALGGRLNHVLCAWEDLERPGIAVALAESSPPADDELAGCTEAELQAMIDEDLLAWAEDMSARSAWWFDNGPVLSVLEIADVTASRCDESVRAHALARMRYRTAADLLHAVDVTQPSLTRGPTMALRLSAFADATARPRIPSRVPIRT
jgi:hypothetical protein